MKLSKKFFHLRVSGKTPGKILWLFLFIFTSMSSLQSYADEADTANIELRTLEEFQDIAVIQRKYLRKTARFELWGSGMLSLNSQFFNVIGGQLSPAYHINEKIAIEGNFIFSTNLEKNITDDLRNNFTVNTEDLVTPETYYGLQLRWSPIYGKISLREKTITPFEIYFTLGGGLTGTDDGQSVPTLHLGVGQFYPLSKNTTFRWGLATHTFQATAKDTLKGDDKGRDVTAYMIYASVGVSVFFPFTEER